MAEHADEGANPWPGYVDALSTIIMVFIFLVILLGVVITALAQNITREMAEAKYDAEQAREKLREHIEQQQGSPAPQAGADGRLKARLREALTADAPVKGEDKVAVLAAEPTERKNIAVVDGQKQGSAAGSIRIDASQAALALVFNAGVRITEAASAEIRAYFAAHPDIAQNRKIEIWAFANSAGGSISEARRTAYYRALMVRNEMLAHGIPGDRIALKVSVSQREEDRDRVKVFTR